MPSRISLTLLICMIGAAVAVGALFLPPREVSAPAPAPAPADPAGQTEPAGQNAPVEVAIEAFAFTEAPALAPGQTVIVTNNDSVPHTLSADDGSFDTGLLQPGEQASITVPAVAGTYSFFCEVHPAMTGAFTVSA